MKSELQRLPKIEIELYLPPKIKIPIEELILGLSQFLKTFEDSW